MNISAITYPSPTTEERYVDGVTHVIGLAAVAAGCTAFFIYSDALGGPALIASVVIYAVCAILSAGVSAAYHQLPMHDWRVFLRRVDHAAIYAVIAGTFTPLLIQVGTTWAYWILTATWAFAVPGMLFKMFGRNLDSRWSLISYVGMGWFGVLALPDFWSDLPTGALVGIAGGAVFYSIGTLFYRNKTMRYRYAIWHAFGLLGAGSFFAAIWISLFA
ncbi:PAQR family membrane homeostasis protein TrhA [Qipengyuania sp. DGS5-3]|uniref:PAQR family membrane homeostasis protein TrhA n=1 Tax=Qipengyuania sp. DGS5-3 TaxID=3349632 RepID=UPI0036D2F7FC